MEQNLFLDLTPSFLAFEAEIGSKTRKNESVKGKNRQNGLNWPTNVEIWAFSLF